MSSQQLLLGAGSAKEKTYVDDVFSTYLYKGTSTATARNNGINLSGEGGMVWVKRRDGTTGHRLTDTVRGVTKSLESENSEAEGTETGGIESFNNNGFTVGSDADYNATNDNYASWTFRKAPGFFDVVTWTGNGVDGRDISHNLGSVPGCIMIKRTSNTEDWAVYHKSLGNTEGLTLNSPSALSYSKTWWDETSPTATTFRIDNAARVNTNGETYVAYVFAGGESTAATARSVNFPSSKALSWSASTDFHFTGDFTIEYWIKPESYSNKHICSIGSYSSAYGFLSYFYNSKWYIQHTNSSGTSQDHLAAEATLIPKHQWAHIAIVRSGSTVSAYVNGRETYSFTNSEDFGSSSNKTFHVGGSANSSGTEASISNFRVVKGTAVYTSSFRPPTAPLTNITNTKLLCCNNSSVTGSTVTPGTITAVSNPTASIDSPFDDPAAHIFGESGSESIIKTGSYEGTAAVQEIELGWEPQYILLKDADGDEAWYIYDAMRGIDTSTNSNGDKELYTNNANAESIGDRINLNSTGFKITTGSGGFNANGRTHIYIAIRRPDGYCGKPVDAATKVFAVVAGTSNDDIPAFNSGFVTDFTLFKQFAGTDPWYSQSRLTGTGYLKPNDSVAEAVSSNNTWDFMDGYYKATGNWSTFINWMWKRHAGFDVVAYRGNGGKLSVPHSLGGVPEMIWAKERTNAGTEWKVHHKDRGATSILRLHIAHAEETSQTQYQSKLPTATHFFTKSSLSTDNAEFLAMLFRSIDGISKVGSYTGSASDLTIDVGFQPRLVIIKCANTASHSWVLMDSLRGWASGNDNYLKLDSTDAQISFEMGAFTSSGFTVDSGSAFVNGSTSKEYIYYAHA